MFENLNQSMIMNLVFAASIGIMFVFMSISQKKKNKKEKELRDSIKIGDEVVTIGGIVGRVKSVSEESFVIESCSGNLKVAKWSVASVNKGTNA